MAHVRRAWVRACTPGRAAAAALALLVAAACASAGDPGPPVAEPRYNDAPAATMPQPCPPLPRGAALESVSATSGSPGAEPVGGAAARARRVVLMGGSGEVESAARAFAEGAGGGHVLVLRASGSTSSYNDYFAHAVGATPAPVAVATIRVDSAEAGGHDGVLCRVSRAHALWLAGGNQWNYLGRWPQALHDSLATRARNGVAIGGTSAGAMSLGEVAYDARDASVTSEEAVADPLHDDARVSRSPFGQPELAGVLVDTHFMQRSREGRLLAFLARGRELLGRDTIYGVGIDERAAIVIEGGRFTVHAGAPERYVWVYRLTRPVLLEAGRPLALAGVERVRLGAGAEGAWPLDFGRWPVEWATVPPRKPSPPPSSLRP
jgi:cyanophycinase